MRALRRFTVRTTVPSELVDLERLVMNLRWSWHRPTRELFAAVDPEVWQACESDPVKLLGAVSPQRLAQLAADGDFRRRLAAVAADLDGYLTAERWYQTLEQAPARIAYFSPEFGITEALPQYSGGLGILAGDHLKAASDLGVPLVGVGLLYREGYFAQSLSRDGWQLESYPAADPHGLPVTQVRDPDGSELRIRVALPDGRAVAARVWEVKVGRVPLLMLDSAVEENEAAERAITDKLYGGSTEHRFEQEMLLGVGGVRAVRAYCRITGTPQPQVFHTNEGHAGFLGLERIQELMAADGLSFDEAVQAVRAGTVFTTHTPVPAGIDRFPRDLVTAHFGDVEAPLLPRERILELGAEDDPNLFNMAHMGLRLAQRANGVSRLHGEVSRQMFGGLWPGFDTAEVPITSITNGVHGPTWTAPALLGAPGAEDELPVAELWALRRRLRTRLVQEVRHRVHRSGLERGLPAGELGWTRSVFDPDVLTIGFARRVPSYKRLTLMLRDPARLRALLLDPDRPVQLVIAGKSHPHDDGGKALIQQIVQFADDPAVRHRIAFLPGYDMAMARYLYLGSDVWLNNPLRPLEACGTSGMKAALNGALNLSILDGWWAEWFDGRNGWAIPTADGVDDANRRDDLEAAGFYDLLESQVRQRFYERDADGVPPGWMDMVRHTLATLGPRVQATRMVQEYVERLYAPAACASARLAADGYSGAKELAAWRGEVLERWPRVQVRHVESTGAGDTPSVGTSLTLRVEVDLAGLGPSDVTVEAVTGTVADGGTLRDAETVPMDYLGDGEGLHHFGVELTLARPGPFGYTARVVPRNPLLSGVPAELGVVTVA